MKQFIIPFLLFCAISTQAQKKSMPIYLRADLGFSNVKTDHGRGSHDFASAIGIESFVKMKTRKEIGLAFSPNLAYLHTGYQPSSGNVKVNYVSLGLPVGFAFSQEGITLFAGAGPFVNLATSGKYRNYSIDDYIKMKFGNSATDNRKSVDAGVVLKAFLGIGKLNIGMQNNIGTSNLIPKDRITTGSYIKSRNFLLYLSYQIN